MDNLIILSNSPGEVAGWVKPMAAAFAARNSGVKVTLAVLPCPYASGMEMRYGGEISGIDKSVSFREVWRGGVGGGGKKLVLQMGGDPLFGALLAARLRAVWMIYTGRPVWRARVAHYFIPDKAAERRFTAAGVKKERFTKTGNLALDSVPRNLNEAEAKKRLGLSQDAEVISFLPGSRPFEYGSGAAFFCQAAKEVLESFPGMTVLMPIAPTVDEEILTKGLTESGLTWTGDGLVETVLCGGGVRLVRGDVFAAIKASKLVVALPGTNNLQAAALTVPLLMVAPLNEAENIPLDGIPGIIPPSFPGYKHLKRKLVFHFNRREKFVSLPNRLAGKAIVPEHRGLLTPHMVAEDAKELLSSPERLEDIRRGYGEIDFEFGAAEKIAAHIGRYFA